MTSFEDREKSFENKYKHDQELQFKVEVRRNKLLGQWIATQYLGKSGSDAEAYAKEVISSDFSEPGDADVQRKVMADLEAKGVNMSPTELKDKMAEFLAQAKQQVMNE